MNNKNIILASKSPRRREILKNAGYNFKALEADTDEIIIETASPTEVVIDIAMQKALWVKKNYSDENAIIIAADTLVLKDGILLGKPKDAKDAFNMLKMLSGAWHEVYTGYVVLCGDKQYTGCEVTAVKFRTIEEREINEYIQSGEPFDKAGSYGVQDRASAFVERIEGDFFNVMGLPICKISLILNILGVEIST